MELTQLKKELRLQLTARKSTFIIGMVIAFFLVTIPFYFYAYKLIPVSMTETSFFGIVIKAGKHQSLNYYAYYMFTKLTFLLAFILWFYTCKYWWRWALVVPICMLVFQIMGLVNTQIDYIDEFDFWYSVPIILPVSIFLGWTSMRINKYRKRIDLKDEIENELIQLKKADNG